MGAVLRGCAAVWVGCAVLAWTHPAAVVAEAQDPGGLAGLDALVERGLRDHHVPGLAIAIVKDGQVLLAKGYGVRTLRAPDAVTPDTLFYIGSATKSFTATLAAMMAAEGLVAWDRPIRDQFPDFRMHDPAATDKTTFRDLLCHRTGIPRQEFLKVNAPERRTDLIARLRYFEPTIDFRSGFQYCNETVSVAGDLLGRRAGTTWEALVRQRILVPLGMSRSAVTVDEMTRAGNHATPYIIRDKGAEELALYDVSELRGPAGAVISSARDMARWVLFNLNRGSWEGKPLVAPQALAQLLVPQMPATRSAPAHAELSHQSYGLGWFIDSYRGALRVSHPGNLYGYTALVSFLPRHGVGVAVLANMNTTRLPEVVERFVYDQFLKLPPVDWSQRLLDEAARQRAAVASQPDGPDPGRRPDTRPSHSLAAYAGTYVSPGLGTVQVRQAGETLTVAVRSGTFPLRHYNHDAYEFYHPVEAQSWLLMFRSDPLGAIGSFVLESAGGAPAVVFTRAAERAGRPAERSPAQVR